MLKQEVISCGVVNIEQKSHSEEAWSDSFLSLFSRSKLTYSTVKKKR